MMAKISPNAEARFAWKNIAGQRFVTVGEVGSLHSESIAFQQVSRVDQRSVLIEDIDLYLRPTADVDRWKWPAVILPLELCRRSCCRTKVVEQPVGQRC